MACKRPGCSLCSSHDLVGGRADGAARSPERPGGTVRPAMRQRFAKAHATTALAHPLTTSYCMPRLSWGNRVERGVAGGGVDGARWVHRAEATGSSILRKSSSAMSPMSLPAARSLSAFFIFELLMPSVNLRKSWSLARERRPPARRHCRLRPSCHRRFLRRLTASLTAQLTGALANVR